MDDQNKNLILATALSFLVILAWFVLFPPEEPAVEAPSETAAAGPEVLPPVSDTAVAPPSVGLEAVAEAEAATGAEGERDSGDASRRVEIDTPRLGGSVSLTGGRIDTLDLRDYTVELDGDRNIQLLRPAGSTGAYYALHGWAPGGVLEHGDVPNANTPWTAAPGAVLTPDRPLLLEWNNGKGQIFRREIAIDDDYLFTIRQSVENTAGTAVRMAPYGIVARHGEPDVTGFFILHEGVVRMTDGELSEIDYDDMPDLEQNARERGRAEIARVEQNGWIGFTDKYWMTTLIPQPGVSFSSVVKYVPGADIYQTEVRLPTVEVPPGETAVSEQYLFAGAKEWDAIRGYESGRGIDGFIDSIDWGWFFFLTKPIFAVLHWLNAHIGNMGWSIIVLTLLIKAVLFPLAFKSYVSMAKMKELQPEMTKIREKVGEDRQKLQKEMMELYKREKVNPAAGCLPIILQIPIFFSLYKVIFVTIELYHAPWLGWIRDLSAPDPSTIYNLFGILPWGGHEPGSLLASVFIGIMPILLGVTMWLQQKLNPAPPDPTQAMIFAWMPWVFMFILGGFASGLVLYWIASNVITFLQQYLIMRSQGYKPDILGNILSGFEKKSGGGKAEQ